MHWDRNWWHTGLFAMQETPEAQQKRTSRKTKIHGTVQAPTSLNSLTWTLKHSKTASDCRSRKKKKQSHRALLRVGEERRERHDGHRDSAWKTFWFFENFGRLFFLRRSPGHVVPWNPLCCTGCPVARVLHNLCRSFSVVQNGLAKAQNPSLIWIVFRGWTCYWAGCGPI